MFSGQSTWKALLEFILCGWMALIINQFGFPTYVNIAIRLVDLETEKEISLWRNSGRKRGSSPFLDYCWDTWWHRGLPAGVVKSSRETMCFSAKTWAFWIFTPRLEPVYLFPSLGVVHLFAPDWSEALTHCTLVSCCHALALFVCSWIWIKLPELEEEGERSLWCRWSWDEWTPGQRSQPAAGVCCQGGSSLYCRWVDTRYLFLIISFFHF